MAKSLKVFQDETGKNYVKQMTAEETAAWIAANPSHTLVRG